MMCSEIKKVRISTEGFMAAASDLEVGGVSNVSNVLFSPYAPKKYKKRWLTKNNRLWYDSINKRVFAYVRTDAGLYFWMDVVTGSFYDSYGWCMSGYLYLDIANLVLDDEKCKKHLMEIDVSEYDWIKYNEITKQTFKG